MKTSSFFHHKTYQPPCIYIFSDFPPVTTENLFQLQRPTDAPMHQIFSTLYPMPIPGHLSPSLSGIRSSFSPFPVSAYKQAIYSSVLLQKII